MIFAGGKVIVDQVVQIDTALVVGYVSAIAASVFKSQVVCETMPKLGSVVRNINQ